MSFEIILDKEPVGTSVFMKDLESGCQVSILTVGALLNGFAIPTNGEYINVIDGYIDNEQAEAEIEESFKGVKHAPFVGKLKKGHFTFNGSDHKIQKYYDGLHAGNGLMYDHKYEIAETKKNTSKAEVKLKGFYAGTDKGFPYKFLSEVVYRLEAPNKLTCETCVQHFHEHAIPYGESWHPFFQLRTTVDDCSLNIESETRYTTDKYELCTGEIVNDDRFTSFQSLEGVSLNDCFELKKKGTAAILKDDLLQLKVNVNEGYNFLHLQTSTDRNSISIGCMSMVPDAFNHGKGLLILEPGKKYIFSCSYILDEAI
jgi:galactose mutarotase-like enzyme